MRPKTDQGRGSGVKPACKLAKSMTETNSKVHEPKTYDETIHDLIHGNKWRKVINKKLWNLDSHQA